MSEPDELLLVHTTCPDLQRAEALARALVEQRLAACATLGAAVRSIYAWDGAIQNDEEIPLTLKTTRSRFDALSEAIDGLHPYDVPEVLAVPVGAASARYADWVRDWVRGDEG